MKILSRKTYKRLKRKSQELSMLKNEINEVLNWCSADSPAIGMAMLYLLGRRISHGGVGVDGFRGALRKGFTFSQLKNAMHDTEFCYVPPTPRPVVTTEPDPSYWPISPRSSGQVIANTACLSTWNRLRLRDKICNIELDGHTDEQKYLLQGALMYRLGFSKLEAHYPDDTWVGTIRRQGWESEEVARKCL